jgi:hypothetical protein
MTVPATGLSDEPTYWSGAWLSWMINLLVAELLIGRTLKRASTSPNPV